jgi:hypothetical protein
VILGAAARRLSENGNGHRRPAAIEAPDAVAVLAGGARSRLDKGLALIRSGTTASGLLPDAPLSPAIRVAFAVALALALAGSVLAVLHGYRAPAVPHLPAG